MPGRDERTRLRLSRISIARSADLVRDSASLLGPLSLVIPLHPGGPRQGPRSLSLPVTTWLSDKPVLVRLAASPDAVEWASRIECGLVRITTVTQPFPDSIRNPLQIVSSDVPTKSDMPLAWQKMVRRS